MFVSRLIDLLLGNERIGGGYEVRFVDGDVGLGYSVYRNSQKVVEGFISGPNSTKKDVISGLRCDYNLT